MRPHSPAEAATVIDLVESWQDTFLSVLGRRLVYAADEYYLLTGRSFPSLATYGSIAQHDNGVGMARAFEARFHGRGDAPSGGPGGFFQSVDGAPASGYRAPRAPGTVTLRPRRDAPVTVLTGTFGAPVLRPLVAEVAPGGRGPGRPQRLLRRQHRRDRPPHRRRSRRWCFVTAPMGRRYLLPDVCLSGGRFLDGQGLEDLPRPVEVLPADGAALRAALSR